MTRRQNALICHACGVGGGSSFYRNRFYTTPGSECDLEWAELVSLGLAEIVHNPEPPGKLRLYRASSLAQVLVVPEHAWREEC